MKKCCICKKHKDLKDFHSDKSRKDGLDATCRSCRKVNTDKRTYIKSMYGITQKEYLELLESQNGRCAICKQLPRKHNLAIDHDHKTGKIRGLLCHKCNTALGLLGEDWMTITRAANYVR